MKKIISCILSCALLGTNEISLTNKTQTDTNINNRCLQNDITANDMEAITTIDWTDWIYTAIKWVIYKVDNTLYNVNASKTYGSDFIRVSPGSINYNNGTNGPSSYIDLVAISPYGNNMTITVSATCSFLVGLTNVIAVTLTKPNGTYAINQTLGMNGIATYTFTTASQEGIYRSTYSTVNNQKWTPTSTLYDNSAPSSKLGSEQEIIIDYKNNKYYLIPSDPATQKKAFKKQMISVDELYEQFWDDKRNDYVYKLSDYDPGDTIRVKDSVKSIVYEREYKRTVISFGTRRGEAYWPFDGDLTDHIKAGDEMLFEFKVIDEYKTAQYDFETLDYFKEAEKRLYDSSQNVDLARYQVYE